MTANIGCYVSGCPNAVVGQCPGYKKGCGRFYCAEHSFEGLCSDCARAKREDEMLQDYMQTAENLLHCSRYPYGGCLTRLYWLGVTIVVTALAGLIGCAIGLLVGGEFADDYAVGIVIATWLVMNLLLGIWDLRRRRRHERDAVAEISVTKPGFEEFYVIWKKDKYRQGLITGLSVAGVLALAAAAGSTEREQRVSEIEEGVRRGLR